MQEVVRHSTLNQKRFSCAEGVRHRVHQIRRVSPMQKL